MVTIKIARLRLVLVTQLTNRSELLRYGRYINTKMIIEAAAVLTMLTRTIVKAVRIVEQHSCQQRIDKRGDIGAHDIGDDILTPHKASLT